jgi:hypothetical protein
VVLARGLCGAAVNRTAADLNGFDFASVDSYDHEMMLPGALKYGGLPTLAALCSPHRLLVHNCQGTGSAQWLQAAYANSGQVDNLRRVGDRISSEDAVDWLLRPGK